MAGKVKAKVSSGLKKVSKRADMAGAVLGYLGTFGSVFKAEGHNFVQGLVARHVNAITVHNVTNLASVGDKLADGNWNSLLYTGVGVGIAGVVAKELPHFVPWQGTVGSIAAKAGFGMIIGAGAAMIVGALSEGSGGSTLGGSRGGSQPGATTSGRVPYHRKYMATYPTDGTGTWIKPR